MFFPCTTKPGKKTQKNTNNHNENKKEAQRFSAEF